MFTNQLHNCLNFKNKMLNSIVFPIFVDKTTVVINEITPTKTTPMKGLTKILLDFVNDLAEKFLNNIPIYLESIQPIQTIQGSHRA